MVLKENEVTWWGFIMPKSFKMVSPKGNFFSIFVSVAM